MGKPKKHQTKKCTPDQGKSEEHAPESKPIEEASDVENEEPAFGEKQPGDEDLIFNMEGVKIHKLEYRVPFIAQTYVPPAGLLSSDKISTTTIFDGAETSLNDIANRLAALGTTSTTSSAQCSDKITVLEEIPCTNVKVEAATRIQGSVEKQTSQANPDRRYIDENTVTNYRELIETVENYHSDSEVALDSDQFEGAVGGEPATPSSSRQRYVSIPKRTEYDTNGAQGGVGVLEDSQCNSPSVIATKYIKFKRDTYVMTDNADGDSFSEEWFPSRPLMSENKDNREFTLITPLFRTQHQAEDFDYEMERIAAIFNRDPKAPVPEEWQKFCSETGCEFKTIFNCRLFDHATKLHKRQRRIRPITKSNRKRKEKEK